MVNNITLNNALYIRCDIREHASHMLGCVVIYKPDTLEGALRKEAKIFARNIKCLHNVVGHLDGFGYGLGDPAGFYIDLNQPAICELKNVSETEKDKMKADYIDCRKDD